MFCLSFLVVNKMKRKLYFIQNTEHRITFLKKIKKFKIPGQIVLADLDWDQFVKSAG